MKLNDYLEGTEFELKLIKSHLKFVPKHINEALKNNKTNYENYGSNKEKK